MSKVKSREEHFFPENLLLLDRCHDSLEYLLRYSVEKQLGKRHVHFSARSSYSIWGVALSEWLVETEGGLSITGAASRQKASSNVRCQFYPSFLKSSPSSSRWVVKVLWCVQCYGLCATCSVLCAMCYVLCAVLCATCYVLWFSYIRCVQFLWYAHKMKDIIIFWKEGGLNTKDHFCFSAWWPAEGRPKVG